MSPDEEVLAAWQALFIPSSEQQEHRASHLSIRALTSGEIGASLRVMKYRLQPLIVILLFLPSACSRGVSAPEATMLKCRQEMERIPRVAPWLKARGKHPEQIENQPLKGLELALTINRMVRKTVDPDADLDDWCYTENTIENFDKLVAALKQNQMPPTVDFIVGQAFDVDIQEAWLRSGNYLGNMTYSRVKPKNKTAKEFIESIERNEQTLAPLLSEFPAKQKYFRFPGLVLDSDQEKLSQISAYLKQSGYTEVPATIDAEDDFFSQAYCSALARGDHACAALVKSTFRSLLLDKTLAARDAARSLAGSEVKHILIIKANQLTCDMLGELLTWYKALGVRFISLDEALSDPFYASGNPTAMGNRVIDETGRSLNSPKPKSDQ
jgi:peptidoglycan-N-acetylglucosamine deacetylase